MSTARAKRNRGVGFGGSITSDRAILDAIASEKLTPDQDPPHQPEPQAVAPPPASHAPAAPATTDNAPELSNPSALSKLLQEAIAGAIGPLQAQVTQSAAELARIQDSLAQEQAARIKAEKELEAAKLEREVAQRTADAVVAVTRGVGIAHPVAAPAEQDAFVQSNVDQKGSPALVIGSNPEFKDWLKMIDEAPKAIAISGGTQVLQSDTREADRYYWRNKQKIWDALADQAKSRNLLRGTLSSTPTRDAVTVKSDVPDELLAMLSLEMRQPNRSRFVFSQFVYNVIELGRSPGSDTIKIAKYADLADPSSIADYQLTPGTALVSTSDPISEKAVACTIEELGRGKNANAQPIGISTFISSYTLHDLVSEVQTKLGLNYRAYTDLRIRSLFATANTVLYNNKNSVTDTIGDLAAGDIGQMTPQFLASVLTWMQEKKVPPFEDGYYAVVMPPRAIGQFMGYLAERERYLVSDSAAGSDIITEMFRRMTGPAGDDITQLNGYHGVYSNFHIFSSNAYGTQAAGTEGVQDETIAGGAKTTRTSYAFGMRPVGRGTALPVEIRAREINDFNRSQSYIWYSHEGYVGLDINDVPNNYEDRRVVKLNTTDVVL